MINISLIKKFLCLETHNDVIDLVDSITKTVSKHFIVLRNKQSTIYIPKTISKPLPALCAHTDTVFEKKPTTLSLQIKHGVISNKNKEGIGGDDRAGCYFLSQVMKTNPKDFIFCFFDEEETGCKGARAFQSKGIKQYVKLWVGFDRKSNGDIATYRVDNKELTKAMNADYFPGYKKAWGSSTDVAVLARETKIACINFSIGFLNEHTSTETLSLQALDNTFTLVEPLLNLPLKQYEEEVVIVKPYNYGGYNRSYPYDNYDAYNHNYNTYVYDTYYCPICKREYEMNEKFQNFCCGKRMIRLDSGGY